LETGAVEAEMVGFYAPGFLYAIQATGLHLHCVSKDRAIGGHVLDCQLTRGTATCQHLENMELLLPQNSDYSQLALPNPKGQSVPVFADRLKLGKRLIKPIF